MQETRVRALVREDPTRHGAAKPVHHSYWACVPQLLSLCSRAREPQLLSLHPGARTPQLLKPTHLEPVLRNKRSHCNEKPTHHNEEQTPLSSIREKPTRSNEDPTQPKINKLIKKNKKVLLILKNLINISILF